MTSSLVHGKAGSSTDDSTAGRRLPRVLCLARNYPNNVIPRLGLWTERLVQSCAQAAEFNVIAPVPYWPPVPGPVGFTRFRSVARREQRGGVDVYHPRFLTGPGSLLHELDIWPYYASVTRVADRLHRAVGFDLIHAHFVYPDGWTGAKLARRYGVPLVITEQSSWRPWLDRYPGIRAKALWAASQSRFVVAVSRSLRASIAEFIGESDKLRVIPNVVDGSVFTLGSGSAPRDSNRLLFVGLVRHVKGLDILLRAVRILLDRGRHVKLAVIGESFYEGYRREYEAIRAFVTELGLESAVDFLGGKSPTEVAAEMRASAVLVLPSRRETFAAVLAEALASGTPVVATRCGGPEDIVNADVGVLVPPEDPEALADGIARVLDQQATYDPQRLRASALTRFGIDTVGRQMAALYDEALGRV